MPDPTAHADDMKSLAVIEPNTSPAFWWVNPWAYALSMKRALDAVHLLSETTEDAYQAATTVIKQKQELADYHRNNLNTFQRKVELTLKPACPHLYEDTIGYVQWAADEIKSLRASLSVITEDRDAYIEKLEKANAELDAALERGKELQDKCRLIHGVHQGDVWIAGNHEERVNAHIGEAPDLNAFRFGHMHVHEKPKAKRKPAKKKAKYGDGRDDYSAIGRRYLKHLALVQARRKAIAKAKKKGGRRG